jgi:hypothetical protein
MDEAIFQDHECDDPVPPIIDVFIFCGEIFDVEETHDRVSF